MVLKLRDEKGAFEEMQREKYLYNKQRTEAITKEIMDVETFN